MILDDLDCTDAEFEAAGITEAEVTGRGRSLDQISEDAVVLVETRLRMSGVLELFDQWLAEDSNTQSMGGRPAAISSRAVLTSMLLLAREGAPLHLTRMAALLQHRLSPNSRELLGLPTTTRTFHNQTAEDDRWYNNTVRAFHRMRQLMDPFPVERYTAKSYAQIQQILRDHDEELEIRRKARLDEFTRRFLHMTFMVQPRALRRASRTMDISFDQTFIEMPTTKGFSRKHLAARVATEKKLSSLGEASPGPVDPFAGWHVKSGGGERIDNRRGQVDETAPAKRGDANYQWGVVANLAARVDAEAPGAKRFPGLIVSASLSLPNMEVAEEGAKLLASAASLGLEPGVADADMQYFANALPDRLLRPALELGFTPSTDVRKDRLGVKGGAHGLKFVEGDPYCPSTPQALLDTSIDFREGRIDVATFRARIEERKNYRAHVKEKAKSGANNIGPRRNGGKAMLRCPATGPSPTVSCPLREMFMGAAKKSRPEVEPETLEEEFLDKICTQHSVAVDLTEMKAPQQAFDYGTEEWEEFHEHARNTIESRNHHLKASGDEDIATGGRRRVRGLAAAQMIVTILLVNFNLRKIAAFLNDQARDEARTNPKPRTPRRRDRVWANRYIDTKGNGDLTIPRTSRAIANRNADPAPATDMHPMRT